MSKKRVIILLLLILVIAGFFRLWQLEKIPPGLWPDEAINANTAVQILETKEFDVFYPENHGREGLFFLLISFSFAVFGIGLWSLKFIPVSIGILTILGQYLFSLEFFRIIKLDEKRARLAALLGSFFLAISFWHINFSRIAFRAILTPLVLVFAFYFFFRGIRTKRIFYFLLSGVVFGLGFHTYISFRLAVLLLGFVSIFWFFIALKEKWTKKYLIAIFLLFVMIIAVALPIGLYFLENPEYFMSRAMGVSIFGQENPLFSFLKSFLSHLAMFNFYGDLNWRHNLPPLPQLSLLAGIFFLIGVFWMTYQLICLLKSGQKQPFQLTRIGGFLFIFIWFFSLLLPSTLTVEGIPHALRSIGVIPMAYFFAGLGACFFYEWAKNRWKQGKVKIASFILLIIMIFSSFVTYFIIWASHSQLESAFTKGLTDVGNELNILPVEINKYVIKNEGDLPTEVPKFIQKAAGRDEAIYLEPGEVETINFVPGDFIFIMNKEIDSLSPLINRFPNGNLIEKERILIYEILPPLPQILKNNEQ